MPRKAKVAENQRRIAPSTTVEGRENDLIALAVDLAEKQLREGTASTQVITHYLKLATTREQLEREKLAKENELLQAKADGIRTAAHIEELYEEAIKAMRTYGGHPDEE